MKWRIKCTYKRQTHHSTLYALVCSYILVGHKSQCNYLCVYKLKALAASHTKSQSVLSRLRDHTHTHIQHLGPIIVRGRDSFRFRTPVEFAQFAEAKRIACTDRPSLRLVRRACLLRFPIEHRLKEADARLWLPSSRLLSAFHLLEYFLANSWCLSGSINRPESYSRGNNHNVTENAAANTLCRSSHCWLRVFV